MRDTHIVQIREGAEETRQEFVNRAIQFYQHATVADGGDKARQFQMLLNSFRQWGELYDQGYRHVGNVVQKVAA